MTVLTYNGQPIVPRSSAVQLALIELRRSMKWTAVAAQLGVRKNGKAWNTGTLCAIMEGKRSAPDELALALGVIKPKVKRVRVETAVRPRFDKYEAQINLRAVRRSMYAMKSGTVSMNEMEFAMLARVEMKLKAALRRRGVAVDADEGAAQ